MKGLVFAEFMTMVEDRFGLDMVDDLLDATNPESGGAYTAVGTYNHEELVAMVVELGKRVNVPVADLIQAFGKHLSGVFASKFPEFFAEVDNTLDFLKRIDNHIHVEVKKLYPDAELPVFTFDDSNSTFFKLTYESSRGFADLAQGLIEGCAEYYQQQFEITRHDSMKGDTHVAEFLIKSAA